MADMSQDDLDSIFGGEEGSEPPPAEVSSEENVENLFGGEDDGENASVTPESSSVDDLFDSQEVESPSVDLGATDLDSLSGTSENTATISGVDLGSFGPSGDSADQLGDMDSMLNMVDEQTGDAEDDSPPPNVDVNFLMEMPLTVTFEVGRAKMSISDLLSLGQGSVLELHRLVGEDLDVFVNGKLVARGEVVVYKEKFGARITEIISPTDRVKRMAGMDRYR
ncbi:MAG: flagellar motor switch protein FliN [Deltaproteobacteria bacterium]|jgi:flagellar motor switch protein FliN/FliY